ncbi:MAG: hypothetical protein ACLP5H_26375 [Desulfomonilaceae bacterium]
MNTGPKRKGLATNKEKPPGKRKPQCKPLSLFPLTFDEIVETALSTKPKKKGQNQGATDDPSERMEK